MQYEVSTLINRPLAEVFQFVTNVENQPKWQAASVENRQLTPGPMAAGVTTQHVGKWLGRRYVSKGLVTEFEPNSRWAYKSLDGPYQLEMRYRFETEPGGTRLTMVADGKDAGFFRLPAPLLRFFAQRVLQGDLDRLRKVMESSHEPAR
jgi:uncharacterized protein YndB with AHSA1/START domain